MQLLNGAGYMDVEGGALICYKVEMSAKYLGFQEHSQCPSLPNDVTNSRNMQGGASECWDDLESSKRSAILTWSETPCPAMP